MTLCRAACHFVSHTPRAPAGYPSALNYGRLIWTQCVARGITLSLLCPYRITMTTLYLHRKNAVVCYGVLV